MKAAGLLESPVPHSPPPKGISSARALPQVHEALRQNDPTSKAPSTQPALPKKAPPTSGKGMPARVYRAEEPSRIGEWEAHPQALQLLQQLQHTHLVHLSQLFLNQSKNLRQQRH